MTGIAIGDISQEWAETAIAIPGADQQTLYCDVVAWAALAATLAGDFGPAEVLVARALAAQTALGTSNASALPARGALALFRGKAEEARTFAQAYVDVARASEDPYELADALILLAGSFADSDARIATLEEAIRVARDAGIASALSIALPFLAGSLPIDESDRALALIDEAIEVGLRVGDRRGVALAIGWKGWLAFRRGEWTTALRAALDAAEQLLEFGGLVTIKEFFHLGGAALAALGHNDAAAVLIGRADSLSARVGTHIWLEIITATDAALLEALGEQRVATLAAQGAAFDNPEAVVYLRAQTEAVLREN